MARKASSWPNIVVECILTGDRHPQLLKRLDDILQWLSGTNTKATRRLARAFARKPIAANRARQLTVEFIDHTQISSQRNPWAIFGFADDKAVTPKQIRNRYRRLIRVFHPDRGIGNSQWLAARSEIINKAYSELLEGDIKASDSFHRTTGNKIDLAEIQAKYGDPPLRVKVSQTLVKLVSSVR